MEGKRCGYSIAAVMVLAIVAIGIILSSYTPAIAADRERVQLLVDRARITLRDMTSDLMYTWLREQVKRAKGVLIFPQVNKAGFVWGLSGGTGVLLVKDEETGN